MTCSPCQFWTKSLVKSTLHYKNKDDWHALQIAYFNIDCIKKLPQIENIASDIYILTQYINTNTLTDVSICILHHNITYMVKLHNKLYNYYSYITIPNIISTSVYHKIVSSYNVHTPTACLRDMAQHINHKNNRLWELTYPLYKFSLKYDDIKYETHKVYIIYYTHIYKYKRQRYIIIILSFNFFTNYLTPYLQTLYWVTL